MASRSMLALRSRDRSAYIKINMKELTQREVATKGGYATLKKYGKKHYRKMVEIRWAKVKSKKSTKNKK
jgi:hypothetical protein